MSPPSMLARCAAVVLALGLVSCGGAFRDAMKRGDQYAQAGMWDKAAAEYQTAQRLEPDDTDAAIKLRQMKQKQAGDRLTRGKSLMARGEIEAGLAVIQEAARLDPDNTEAQRALDEANRHALERAEELLATPEAQRAFELTQLVLAGSPRDPRARTMDNRVRDALAARAYGQAEQFAEAGKKGNALIAYAACLSFRPGFRDAKVQIGDVKLALHSELTFHVVLDRFAAPGAGEQDLAARIKPELVAQAFDDRLPLRVVTAAPRADARGVHVAGVLSGYRYGPVKVTTRHDSCEYVRGFDTVPNPARAEAERQVGYAEQRLAQVERDVDQSQREVDRYQRDVDDKQKEQARHEADADRARADHERCMASASKTSSSPCSSEKSHYDSAQSSVQNQRSRLQSSRDDLSRAREAVQRAGESRGRARQDVEERQHHMRDEPPTVQQPHYARENVAIETRTIDAAVILTLRAESLPGRAALLADEAFPQVIGPFHDEGWQARPATCPAQGKRINLPGEDALRGELVKLTIAALRDKLRTIYDSYRTRFLADARRQEASGAPEDAVESYVRYLLTGLKNIDPGDSKQIGEFLQKTRGFGRIDLLGSL